jgi:hypothetical protein
MPYILAVYRWLVCALLAAAPAQARGDGIAIVGGSPRAIGRAGAATVGDDGGGALLINPAAMARRDTVRVQLGLTAIEDDVRWRGATDAAPLSGGQAGSRFAPLGAAIAGLGNWVVGLGAMTAAVSDRSLARPGDIAGPVGSEYDYRYAGISGAYRRDTVALGIARRIGSSIALGLSLGASLVRVTERRRIWAGFASRGPVGEPTSDVDLTIAARDPLSPSAVAGLLYAPEDTQIELGVSVGWARAVKLDGAVDALGSPLAGGFGPSIAQTAAPRATLSIDQPVAVRAGGRYVGDHVVAELDGDLWIAPAGSESAVWSVRGIQIADPSRGAVDLTRLPSRISQHSHVALRFAVDAELIPGFLWATAGYALSTLGTPAERLSPSFGDLGGHSVGIGLETTAGDFTVTLGWARTWSPAITAPSELAFDNPFAAGGDGPVFPGSYSSSLDQIGVLVEGELGRTAR